jgi:cytochrome c556
MSFNMRTSIATLLTVLAMSQSYAQDARQLVELPKPMQEHMLGNMRDHLTSLNEIIGRVSAGKFDEAAKIAEQRLGMSSLTAHDAAQMAPFFPKQMQDMGTSMHHAGSRLVIVLQDASVTPDVKSLQEINRSLHELTSACTSCHAAYRIR